MAPRKRLLHIPHPPRVAFLWLVDMKKLHGSPLTMEQMSHLPKVIKRLQLPCQITREADSTLLRIYAWNAERNPPHARPVLFLTIHDQQVPHGQLPHPRHGTVANARLTSIAINQTNQALCKAAGISPGSLRPGSLYPKHV
jgi:hypothetical protein